MRRPFCVAASLVVVLAGATEPASAQPLPTLTQPVNDLAHVVDEASARELESRLQSLRKASGDMVVVATVATIAPYGSIEEYAVRLFERAGIGRKDKDNGLLIVVAVAEHKVRVEVGYGLESIVTDGFSGETIRRDMLPAFRDSRYGPGLLAGATAIIQHIAEARGITLEGPPAPSAPGEVSRGAMIAGAILFIALCALVLGAILLVLWFVARSTGGARATPIEGGPLGSGSGSSSEERSSGSSDSGGSSSGGFDGGSSGGGGASGSW